MDLTIAQWKSQYETGDPIVDSQHQNLFSMINGLHNAMLEGQGEDLLEKTIESLRDYTAIHFETEEQFMRQYHYPDYEVHRQKHADFQARVTSLYQTYTQNQEKDLGQLTREVSHLLTQWFIHHIKDEDQRMINFCSNGQALRSPHVQPANLNPEGKDRPQILAQWHSRYETGYTIIDDQHRALFHSINALHQAILAGNSTKELIQRTLKSLHNYTTIHFETEEQFMLKTSYPGYEVHRQKHSLLREKVEELEQLQKTGDDRQLSITLSHFLTNWLINHINGEDQVMINFLREERLSRRLD